MIEPPINGTLECWNIGILEKTGYYRMKKSNYS
jgi:hypothetical protein